VTNATASLWLFPRLSRFRKLYPEIQLRILCFENEVDLLSASVDVAILYGRNRWKDLDAELLFEEDSFPVCSPSYLDDYGPIDDATDLVRHTLIECEYQHPEWPDWQKWLRHHGVSTAAASKRITVSDYPLSIEGARDGLGLALGGTQFLWRDLSKRTLVRPFGGKMLTGWGFYLLRQRGIPVSPELATFRDWLHFEADEIVEGKE